MAIGASPAAGADHPVVRVIPPTALRIIAAIGGLGLAVWLFAKASLYAAAGTSPGSGAPSGSFTSRGPVVRLSGCRMTSAACGIRIW